jgi:urease accessory protein UreE
MSKGKNVPLTQREEGKIELLAADGAGAHKIGEAIGRHHITVEKHLAKPDARERVQDEKTVLANLYRGKARACVEAIDDDKIGKASALQLATAAAICTDKALLLTGDMPPIHVEILLQAVSQIRDQRDAQAARELAERIAAHRLPAPGAASQ